MISRILYRWNFIRILRLAIGIYVLVQGIVSNDWSVALIGGLFAIMPVLNIGCCCTSSCSVPTTKTHGRSVDQIKNNNREQRI